MVKTQLRQFEPKTVPDSCPPTYEGAPASGLKQSTMFKFVGSVCFATFCRTYNSGILFARHTNLVAKVWEYPDCASYPVAFNILYSVSLLKIVAESNLRTCMAAAFVGSRHCAAEFSVRVQKSCTDLLIRTHRHSSKATRLFVTK